MLEGEISIFSPSQPFRNVLNLSGLTKYLYKYSFYKKEVWIDAIRDIHDTADSVVPFLRYLGYICDFADYILILCAIIQKYLMEFYQCN
jgi:hypothetical protein